MRFIRHRFVSLKDDDRKKNESNILKHIFLIKFDVSKLGNVLLIKLAVTTRRLPCDVT